jgi:hypothetical protein
MRDQPPPVPLQLHVEPAGCDDCHAGRELEPFRGLHDAKGGNAVQALGQRLGISVRDVQRDRDRHREIARQRGQQPGERLRASGRGADDDQTDAARPPRRHRHLTRRRCRRSALGPGRPRGRRGLDLGDQLGRDFVQLVGGQGGRLVHQVHGAALQRLDAEVAVLVGGADHDHARRVGPAQRLQHAHAVEAGHHQVERHHVGRELGDLVERVEPVARGAHHGNTRGLLQQLAQDLARERGVIDDQHPDGRHAWICLRYTNTPRRSSPTRVVPNRSSDSATPTSNTPRGVRASASRSITSRIVWSRK